MQSIIIIIIIHSVKIIDRQLILIKHNLISVT